MQLIQWDEFLCLAHDMIPHGKSLTGYLVDSKPADSGPLRNGDVVTVNTVFLVCT